MSAFELATAARIVFGAGKFAEAPAALKGARCVLIVTGKRRACAEELEASLRADGIACAPFVVPGEPTVGLARAGVAAAIEAECDAVLAIGGGSALDAGKAIAALAANGGDPLDYLEVVGRGRPLAAPSLPFVAVPTTAGTGSEVTRNAVLADEDTRVKASLRSPHMLPRAAIVDPALLDGTPRPVLASCGLDALAQLVEPFLSARRNPLTDALAREGIPRSIRALARVAAEPPDAGTREDLALASLLGGLCLANAGLGAVHGFAAPIGGAFDAPHGAVCAALLPIALEVNLRAARARGDDALKARFDELARLVLGAANARVEDAIAKVAELTAALAIPGLSRWGMREEHLEAMVAKAKGASSMKANPIALSDDELREIASRAL